MKKFHKQKWTYVEITKNGRRMIDHVIAGFAPLFQFERPEDAAPYAETSRGDENLYFTFQDDAGQTHAGYTKCLMTVNGY